MEIQNESILKLIDKQAFDQALNMAKKVEKKSRYAGDPADWYFSLKDLKEVYHELGDLKGAAQTLEQIETLCVKHKNEYLEMYGLYLCDIARVYEGEGTTDKAIEQYTSAITYFKEQSEEFSGTIGYIYFHMGDIQRDGENLKAALEYFKQSSQFLTDQYNRDFE